VREAHDMPPPLLPWPFNLESGVRVTCDAGYLCAILVFLVPIRLSVLDLGPMYAIDRETNIRRVSSFNAPTLGAEHNKSVAMRIDNHYDALCASRLSWLVFIFVMLHQLNTWALCLMQVFWTSNWSYKMTFHRVLTAYLISQNLLILKL